MPHGRRPKAGPGRNELVCAQVVVGGGFEVDESLLPQLHHGNGGECLGDGGDAKDRVFGDGCVRRDICQPMSVKEGEASVANYSDRHAYGRPSIEDLVDPRLHLGLIDHVSVCLDRWIVDIRTHRFTSLIAPIMIAHSSLWQLAYLHKTRLRLR